jgi:hypothetical protein
LSSDLDWYRGKYEALDAFVEALRTNNGWLEYRLRAMQDALLDQRALTAEGTTSVDRVKTALLERDEALATADGEQQKAHAALDDAQTTVVEKEIALTTVQTQLQQDRATLEGHGSGRLRPSRRPRRPRGWVLTYRRRSPRSSQRRSSFARSGACVSRRRTSSSRSGPPSTRLRTPFSASAQLERKRKANSNGSTPRCGGAGHAQAL